MYEPSKEDHSKGNRLAANEQYHEAIGAYTRAIEKLDHKKEPWLSSVLYYNRGNAFAALGKHEEAIKDFQMALKPDGKPSAPKRDILKNMGNSRYELEQFEATYRDFEKAEEVMEGSDLNLAMGNCLVEMGSLGTLSTVTRKINQIKTQTNVKPYVGKIAESSKSIKPHCERCPAYVSMAIKETRVTSPLYGDMMDFMGLL